MSTSNAIVDVGRPSNNPYPEWETTYVRFNNVDSHSNANADGVAKSPEFTSCGQKWQLFFWPEGFYDAVPGMMSLFISNAPNEEPLDVIYSLTIKDRVGKEVVHFVEDCEFESVETMSDEWEAKGPVNFVEKSKITESVLQNGSLVIEVRLMRTGDTDAIKKTNPLFIPENPSACKMIQKMFMNEKTSDVIFEVGEVGGVIFFQDPLDASWSPGILEWGNKEPKSGSRKKAKKSPSIFYAHRLILEQCSTTLSDLCASSSEGDTLAAPIQITDVNADMFHNILYYIYGGKVPNEFMKSNFKEIIEASDKYGVSNLKLVAEACYVESTTITTENLMEHLLYADSKNCALLKEKVMDYIAENDAEVLRKVSFTDFPGGATMFTDILTSMARRNREGDEDSGDDDSDDETKLTTLKVCDLRRKAHEKGLEIDGSRETLIASLAEST